MPGGIEKVHLVERLRWPARMGLTLGQDGLTGEGTGALPRRLFPTRWSKASGALGQASQNIVRGCLASPSGKIPAGVRSGGPGKVPARGDRSRRGTIVAALDSHMQEEHRVI